MAILSRLRYPVEGFQGTAYSQINLQVHFVCRHPKYTIVILKEGNQPHPWCPQCGMFVPQEAPNWSHPTSVMCWRGTERKQRRLLVEETEEHMGRVLFDVWDTADGGRFIPVLGTNVVIH